MVYRNSVFIVCVYEAFILPILMVLLFGFRYSIRCNYKKKLSGDIPIVATKMS